MKTYFHNEQIIYDGSNLQSLYAYKNFDVNGDSVISFTGPCLVDEHLVDIEDKKAHAFIRSDNMVHFIIEHFDISLTETIFRQRLFIAIIRDYLGSKVIRKGDDLFYDEGKLSVSIATQTPVSTIIHTGINIITDNTPIHTASLSELSIDPSTFAKAIMTLYKEEIEDIYFARRKVRGVI
ncbi:MAG: DUF366 domain-containing protein [Candidatus Margulisiibacteriota bacterium]|nr:MAG: hypothetical protein A2X43_10240 [Candidatus Margulisbacteria bacterium GWD2_39_127]OGI05440.1 MAG: hypothetical protein A2X42_09270 [Candidatus Margulisbacteria bacterium GWF2_38_17]OGI07822.1 MAG: hypothetical protein A2X41_11885 [Candidatus Margulisbacteria bacterium GWE2_39_32]PZM80122.1 MAG: DUF366 domain-containing protein [Candidatus Margulisiibacteriota bacterium]HAR62612.1 DUF366 domain-containing protein [Candidatus Margulisiibacteriota bacterium]